MKLTSFEDIVGALVGLGRTVINLDALEDAWNNLTDDLECSLVACRLEAELRARS